MAYGLTKSANLVRASSQSFSRANAAALNPTSALTCEAWVNFASTASANYAVISKGNVGGIAGPLIFYINPGAATMNLYISNGTTTTTKSVSWTPSTSTWYHIASTLDSSGNVIFTVNGVQQGSTQTSSNLPNGSDTAPFWIGAYSTDGSTPNSATVFDGNISLARFWSTNLSVSTINSNICNVYGSAQTNMIGEWSLDNVLTDASGNAFTLTNVNTATFTTSTPSTCATVISSSNLALMGIG